MRKPSITARAVTALVIAFATPAALVPGQPAFADTTVIQDTDLGTGVGQIEYSPEWNHCAAPACADGGRAEDGSFHWASTNGAKATIRFSGTSITLFGVMEPWSNIATVSIDGGPTVDVDFYAPSRTQSVAVWTSPGLATGTHTLVLTKTLRRNPASTGGDAITFDRAEPASATPDHLAPPRPTSPDARSTGAHRIDLNWADSKARDFASYSVYRSTNPWFNPSPSTQIAAGLTASRHTDLGLRASQTYFYKVAAVDKSGRQSSSSLPGWATTQKPPPVAVIQDIDTGTGYGQVDFTADWNPCTTTCDLAFDGSYLWTSLGGAAATIRFYGNKITLYGFKEPWSNIATISIDGGAPVDVDFYASPTVGPVAVFTSPWLASRPHALTITKTDRRNPASSGGDAVTFDRAVVVNIR